MYVLFYSHNDYSTAQSFTSDGELRLFLLKSRRVEIEGNETVLLFSQPVPKSRYVEQSANDPTLHWIPCHIGYPLIYAFNY